MSLGFNSCSNNEIGQLPDVPVQIFSDTGDNTSVDLRAGMTPVKHQGNRGTCNAFAATSLMEFLIKSQTGKNIDLSESYNYWAGKKYTLKTPFLKESYENSDGLAGFMAVQAYSYGSMEESQWPYESSNWYQTHDLRCKTIAGKPQTECFTGVMPANAKLLQYKIVPQYIEKEKIGEFIIRERKPVVFNISWIDSTVNASGDIRMPKESEVKDGNGHAIILVGYDSSSRRFIFRNSWGSQWGNKGYGTIPEDYINKYCEICPNLPPSDTYSPEIKDFIIRASMGTSGSLK